MSKPTVKWTEGNPNLPLKGDWEGVLAAYFRQSKDVDRIDLTAMSPGRSGAFVLVATPWATRGKGLTKLQPELVKVANLDRCNLRDEIDRFRRLAEGTALVYGQTLARPPYVENTATGLAVFGYKLFEAETAVYPFYAVALADLGAASRGLGDMLDRLIQWYGETRIAQVGPLPVDSTKLDNLLVNLVNLERNLGEEVRGLLEEVKARRLSAAVTRVHGDLHLENVLIDPTGARTYLIDFGTSSDEGSVCADLARLESDLIYRLLPYDLTADQIAAFEQAAWDGKLADQPASVSRTLITLLRQRIERFFGTSHGQVWYLIGRLVNGMRMLTGTWHEVTPYGFALRRQGITASLGVIASRLKKVLSGSSVFIVQPIPSEPHAQADAEKSLRWLFVQRHSSDAWNLASKIGKTGTQLTQTCCFLGALAGASIGRPSDEVDTLVERAPARVTQPGPKGLRALYVGFQRARTPKNGSLAAAVRAFEESQEAFKESGDDLFQAIAADQLARVRMRQGNYEAAKIQFDTSIDLKTKARDQVGLAASLGGLAQLYLRTLEYKLARELYQKDYDLVAAFDPVSAIRILNWIGQALLEENVAQVTDAIGHFDQSLALAQGTKLPGYNPTSDIGFAHLGRGSCYTRSDAIDLAVDEEAAARATFESLDQEDDFGIALVELLSGEIAYCRGHPRTGMLRTLSGLDRLERPVQDRLVGLDHGVRACRFLRRIGRMEDCRKIAGRLRSRFKNLHSQKLQRILQGLEEGP